MRVVLHTFSVHSALGDTVCIVYVFFIECMFFLHTLIVHWAIQSPIIARCTALLCVWCIVCFLVFLQRTLGNAVQCCVVSIWILCAILVLLAALIWRQILLVVFVFRKKASRISGNYISKNNWSDQRLWGLVTLIRGTIPIACFVFLLHWSCICHPGLVTKKILCGKEHDMC